MIKSKMPVLFIGHGSPMNALEKNDFTKDLSEISSYIPQPETILVISAHWQTHGTMITSSDSPMQIYDFNGFPEELYQIKYTPPGSSKTATDISKKSVGYKIIPDDHRGIDHAAWAVIRHIYPDASVPLMEMSLDIKADPVKHIEIAKSLSHLRENGILIVGSGNIVHNLHVMSFDQDDSYDWAEEFDVNVKQLLLTHDMDKLANYSGISSSSKLAVPTDEHYIPMLYSIALKQPDEQVEFIHESIQYGSISMRSFVVR